VSEAEREAQPAAPTAASIGRLAGAGLRWTLAETLIGTLGSFPMSLVLARLLVSSNYA